MDLTYSDYYRKIGLNIAYYRKDRLFTQQQLGEKLNVDQAYISRIETAAVGISFDTLFELAEALEVEPYKFLQFRD